MHAPTCRNWWWPAHPAATYRVHP
ncbi:trp operon leader peptide [Streptomyces sp. A7024]|uniref:Trp operon leader peptide n=1 Tax=Streptomyces coryli TaxID=1128680 RepID=A0A6G4UC64_9ACTN|nr:trp operon leader peptide [Streptomyces coryli]